MIYDTHFIQCRIFFILLWKCICIGLWFEWKDANNYWSRNSLSLLELMYFILIILRLNIWFLNLITWMLKKFRFTIWNRYYGCLTVSSENPVQNWNFKVSRRILIKVHSVSSLICSLIISNLPKQCNMIHESVILSV